MTSAATGYLYTVTNDAEQNGVAVLQQNADGSLTEIAGSLFPAGGKGLGGGDIDQQGAIHLHGAYVLSVNPGSNSVAVFHKSDRGGLTPVAGSPFPSRGSTPLSLTVHEDLVYVANQAASFAKPSSAPNIVGFRMSNHGALTPVAKSTIDFPAGHGAAQIEFNPKGRIVALTSGFQDEGTGAVKQVGDTYKTHGTAPCWTVLSSDGKTLYVANFVSNSISVFDVRADGELTYLGTAKRRGATGPDTKDLVLSKDGKFLYAVGSGRRNISVFSIGANRKLTELPKDKSPLKLRAGKNILGLAID